MMMLPEDHLSFPFISYWPYWNHFNAHAHVSYVCVDEYLCGFVSGSAHQSNNERLTERQHVHNNVKKIEFSSFDRHTKIADWICDLFDPLSLKHTHSWRGNMLHTHTHTLHHKLAGEPTCSEPWVCSWVCHSVQVNTTEQSHFLPVASRCENDNTITVKQDTLDLEVGAQRRREESRDNKAAHTVEETDNVQA